MEHILVNPESNIGKAFLNEKGNAECVEFIKQTLNAPVTATWTEGTKITSNSYDMIAPGTAIATFINGKYPQTGSTGMHAAIFLSKDVVGITVLDQWRAQGVVKKRLIRWTGGPSLSNNGSAFSTIEW